MRELTVMVVDDEPLVREYFRSAFPWERVGFRWSGEAPDGESALRKCREAAPDLVLVDITMPRMDGLTFIQQARAELPALACMVLTCHEEFHRVQAALRLGAMDYLVKGATGEDEMVEALQRVRGRIELERQAVRNRPGRRDWLRRLLLGEVEPAAIETDLTGYGLPLEARRVRVMVLDITEEDGPDEGERNGGPSAALSKALDGAAAGLGQAEWTTLSGQNPVLVATFATVASEGESARLMHEAFRQVLECVGRSALAGGGLSSLHPRLADARSATAEAALALESRFYLGRGRLLTEARSWRPAPQSLQEQAVHQSAVPPGVPVARHASQVIPALLDSSRTHWVRPNDARLVVTVFLQQLARGLKLEVPPWELAMWPVQASQSATAHDLQTWALQIAGALAAAAQAGTLHPDVRRVVTQIRADLSSEYDLAWAARVTGLNPNYFSGLFRDEVGQTFTEYVSRLRMEKAAGYLRDGAWKTYQIAEMVGVPNYRTFCKTFRRVMGMSPTEFKARFRLAAPAAEHGRA